jgi:hypothetical protein
VKIFGREPALWMGGIQALIALLVGFNILDWSTDQQSVVVAFVAAFLSVIVRQSVTPVAKLETQTSDSTRQELADKKLL